MLTRSITHRARRATVILALSGLVAACGTTVPLADQGTNAGQPGASSGLNGRTGASAGSVGISGSAPAPGAASSSAGGGGTGATGSSTGAAGSTSAPGAIPSGTGTAGSPGSSGGSTLAGAAVTTPIEVGYLAASSSTAATSAIGAAATGTSEDPQDAFAYFVDALNAQGGIDGRPIQVVEDFVSPESADYNEQAVSACADFSQDHHVAVVFSVESDFYSPNFSACMAKAGIPEFLATVGGVDNSTLAQYPTLFSITAPTVERRFVALIDGLSGRGFLSPTAKIGVIVEDCSYDVNAYNDAIGPAFKAHNLDVYRRDISCVTGFGDAASAIAAIQSEVLPFKAEGVKRVIIVSGFEGLMAEFFEKQAESQDYAPYYAFTSAAGVGFNNMGFSNQAMARVEGVGWQPDSDLTNEPAGTAAAQRCHAIWKGYAPAAERDNLLTNDTTCEEFFTFEAALKLTKGASDEKSVLAAMGDLGASVDSVLSLNGSTLYSSQRKDGPQSFSTFAFQPSCSCIRYMGQPSPSG